MLSGRRLPELTMSFFAVDRSFLLTLDLKLRQALEERQAAEEVHEATAQAQVARLAAAAAAVRQVSGR